MKIRLGFVSNSSSSSFVVYNFVIIPEGVEIDALYDNLIPEEKTELRENINWGKKIDNITAKLDKESALEEVKKLIEQLCVSDDLVLEWLQRANVDSFEQMTYDRISKAIEYLNKKLNECETKE